MKDFYAGAMHAVELLGAKDERVGKAVANELLRKLKDELVSEQKDRHAKPDAPT